MAAGTASGSTLAWGGLLAQLRADCLDCLQTSLALLADASHGAGTHLDLGACWGFAPGPDGEPARSTGAELQRAGELLGLEVARTWRGSGSEVRRAARDVGPLYVVADAFALPWLPYAGNEHMAHSFVLDPDPDQDRVAVVDAYHNDTRWGPARPGTWILPAGEFDALFGASGVAHLLRPVPRREPDVPAALAGNARRIRAARPAADRWLAGVAVGTSDPATMNRVVLDIWLLTRQRALHAAWLRQRALPAESVELMAGLVRGWQELAMHSYVALRQLQRGRAPGSTVPDRSAQLLRAELDVAEQLAGRHRPTARTDRAAADVPAGADVPAAVRLALTETLGVDGATIAGDVPLLELPGFDSFRLVDLLGRVERLLEREYDPTRLSAESLRDIDSLTDLFAVPGDLPAGEVR